MYSTLARQGLASCCGLPFRRVDPVCYFAQVGLHKTGWYAGLGAMDGCSGCFLGKSVVSRTGQSAEAVGARRVRRSIGLAGDEADHLKGVTRSKRIVATPPEAEQADHRADRWDWRRKDVRGVGS